MSEASTPDTPGAHTYRPVPAQVDLPAMEHEIISFWRDNDVFARVLEATEGKPPWTFYEGPPTANGAPGTHHIEARVFKDIFPRHRSMKGYHVVRKAGWDCHGLPVEIAVEQELGLSSKNDIESYGIAAFNERCRESVQRHVDAFEEMTERMGYWIDMSRPYRTMDSSYIQSVWWSLKQIFDAGLLVEDHRVAPYCPRCETSLSSHELALGYETVADPSVYVRLPITSGPWQGRASLLVWTTTPWTLVSNTSVAVHPDVTYVAATDSSETLIVAEKLFDSVLGEGWTVTDRFTGAEMERWGYQRPFELVELTDGEHPAGDVNYVVVDDYVTTDDGTGLVHQAPAFGADDLRVCRRYGLPVVNPVRADGTFGADVPLVGGQFFKHADTALTRDLEERGLMFHHTQYEHEYPHCWRCHTPLLYYAQPSWYIRTTQFKDALLRENEKTNWYPDTIKWGRYGEWLRGNVDWSLSRNRYWGTPLPIWRNDEDPSHLVCVGSLAELSELAGTDLSNLDPHRPFVDDITFTLDGVPGTFRREPYVIDAWYDSGSMPFAQWGYPHAPGSTEAFENAYPAQFICEGIDQTRGWFYTLMAVGTAVFGRSSYENVLCLGLLLAEDGRKMSKHLGNVIEPFPLMDDHGADAVRWFMAAHGSPWQARPLGPTVLGEIVRKVLLTYWNTVSFLSLYGRTSGWSPGDGAPAVDQRPVLDRWALSELNRLVADVDAALDAYDTQRAGSRLATFIDDLSNWYVRRSRRRFWDGDPAALATLHECVETLTRLLAPITPFITERVWQDLVVAVDPSAAASVHMASWPEPDTALVDDQLAEEVALTRRLVELGRAARAESKIRTRQPLARALVGAWGWDRLRGELRAEIADELNVTEVMSFSEAASSGASGDAGDAGEAGHPAAAGGSPGTAQAGDTAQTGDPDDAGSALLDVSAKANFRSLGKRYAKDTPKVAAAIAETDAAELAASLRASGSATLTVEDVGDVVLSPEDVVITETPREGWAVVREGETVALDLTLTDELVRAGLVREVIRLIQEARKASGFDVADRIELAWSASPDAGQLDQAVREHQQLLADEVLAVSVHDELHALDGEADHTDEGLGFTFRLRRATR
ncbi:isoleucine--tRNA ligase [Actinobacteria bacterium YIM 96077]|uniref:Isoleucine--tRNA ligase n=1 Tax=Phytoactinopolyspora halophila TaxID=1981511 RepID=A0A329QVM1_9ACTN|nr:isoleucine--tRNA ligase [Phytoactinopolyspora halophila]AYY12852.1 isoleucine--tRNA ligase [Actinobacteria bacterium YIM 96077]RAW16355.1 isoleucine--tRNA ligase [Phytoactinopolyspora halophila]